MSRPQRIEYKNAYYHVMNSGLNGKVIFNNEKYVEAFLETLDEAHERFGIEVHAYCILKNNYHLLLKTPEGNLQRAMRQIGGVYTQRHNRLKKTTGSLFKGRYKAVLVDPKLYLLELSKFIHRIPLKEGFVKRIEDYANSSCQAYIGQAQPQPWLFQQEIYALLKPRPQTAKEYQRYVKEKSSDDRLQNFYQKKRINPILGEEAFIDKLIKNLSDANDGVRDSELYTRPTIDEIVLMVSDYYGISKRDIYTMKKGRGVKNQPRKLAMYLSQNMGGYRLTEIAEDFGLKHYGGVSNAIYMIKQELKTDPHLKIALETIYP